MLDVVREWTGDTPIGCPWFALRDPFVARVTSAFRFFESGQLDFVEPSPSQRFVDGVAYYAYVDGRVHRKQFDLDTERREREARSVRSRAGGR